MSRLEEILVTIRDVIQTSEEFYDIPVYYDDSEMSPNVSLPAISFKIGTKMVLEPNPVCTEYQRDIEIRLHTKTVDKRKLQSELYDYEEQMVSVINNARLSNKLDFEIVEVESKGIGALMFNARKEAGQYNETFFSNLLRMKFNIRYNL